MITLENILHNGLGGASNGVPVVPIKRKRVSCFIVFINLGNTFLKRFGSSLFKKDYLYYKKRV
jgi:hypothetical protein